MAKYTEALIHDLSELLQDSDEYNLIVEAGQEPYIKEFQAHSNILRARSSYFRRALSHDWGKKKDHMLIFKKPNIAAKTFEIILRYIYTGVVNWKEEQAIDILEILIAADELELLELMNYGQEYLIEKESKWLQENIVRTIKIVSCHEPFGKLKEHFSQMVEDSPDFIFKSNDFFSLEESVLLSLVQTYDLKIEEIELWHSLIKWGIGNTQRLVGKKLVTWDSEDFAALEKTIHQFIPLIRYYGISGNDYFKHVLPYKKILPKNLRNEILAYHLQARFSPPTDTFTPRFVESRIIESRHINMISSWIDKKAATTNYKSPYTFKLIYRGSRDGFTGTSFRNLCGNQLKTVVVAKITGSRNVVGGYNPLHWGASSNYFIEHSSASDAFIFNFGDGNKPAISKVARCTSGNQIDHSNSFGPYFSNELFFGDDCNISKTCWYKSNHFKPSLFDTVNQFTFQVDELEIFWVYKLEIFEVIKKAAKN
ncbi:hypothetical protein G9A89_008440 [Geosiphon pyriformis]|nr:hypothetical protein G9A89_008440 [Geosiphon pyriformis]